MKRVAIAAWIVCATASSLASAQTFDGQSISLVGTATLLDSTNLQLTKGGGAAGGAWLTTPLSTADSFQLSFGFSLGNLTGGRMADGIALTFQNVGLTALGSAGGYLGYNGLNGVASVLQTWTNNKVGLSTNGDAFSVTKAAPADLGAAKLVLGSETVSYNAATHGLDMVGVLNVDGTSYNISDSATVDLATKFGPTVYAGFTAGTGAGIADQRVTSFGIAAVPEPSTWALVFVGMGIAFASVRRKAA